MIKCRPILIVFLRFLNGEKITPHQRCRIAILLIGFCRQQRVLLLFAVRTFVLCESRKLNHRQSASILSERKQRTTNIHTSHLSHQQTRMWSRTRVTVACKRSCSGKLFSTQAPKPAEPVLARVCHSPTSFITFPYLTLSDLPLLSPSFLYQPLHVMIPRLNRCMED